jgi:putative peptidoglycan lipid II flippase
MITQQQRSVVALNGNANYLGRATVIIAVFSILAKVIGLARDAIFSHTFGTSAIMDAYFAAFRIPDFVFNLLILGTFSVAFIPIFSEYLSKDPDKADRLASSILNVTLLMILFLSLIAFIFIEPLTRLMAPGFNQEQFELTKTFTRIFLLSPIFLTLSSVVSSILNAHKRFTIVAASSVFYNLSIIGGVVLLYPYLGSIGLALGVVAGAFLHFAVQLPQLIRLKFRYSFSIDLKEKGFIKYWKLYWPRIFSMGTVQVSLLVATFYGSGLKTGSLSAIYYANNLQSVFLSVFAISAAIAAFPLLSDLYNSRDENTFKNVIAKTTVQILFFIVPLSALMLIMRAQIVRLILGIGENTSFTFADTRIVSLTLGLMAISLFAQALIPLYNRAFYSRQNTAIPVIIGLATIAFNIPLTYFGVKFLGVPGIALAFSLTTILNLILLFIQLHYTIGTIEDEYMIINTLKILIATAISASLAYLSLYLIAPFVNMNTYLGILIQGTGAGAMGITAYIFAGLALRLAESANIIRLLKAMLIKSTRPITMLWSLFS